MDLISQTTFLGAAGAGGEDYWYTRLYDANIVRSGRMSIDAAGNVYASGTYQNTTFNKRAGTVIKLSSNGSVQWQTRFYDSSWDVFINATTTDNSGNVYAVGTDQGFPFIAKLDAATGSVLGYSSPTELRYADAVLRQCDAAHLVYRDGFLYTTGELSSLAGVGIIKYNTSLGIEWARGITIGGGNVRGGGLDVDASGNVYVSWTYNSGGNWYYIAKISSSGTLTWQYSYRTASSTSQQWANELAVDSSGNVCVATRRQDTSYPSGLNSGIYKVDSSGTFQFSRYFPPIVASEKSVGSAIATDSSNNIYTVAGNESSLPGHIAKFDSSGTLLWQRTVSGLQFGLTATGDQLVMGSVKATQDSVYVSGTRDGLFVMKLPADGSKTGVYATENVTYATSSRSVTNETLTQNTESQTFSSMTTSSRTNPNLDSGSLTQILVTI